MKLIQTLMKLDSKQNTILKNILIMENQLKSQRTKDVSVDNEDKSPEQTDKFDFEALNQKAEQLQSPKLGDIYSHFICPKTEQIVLNTDEGFVIVKDNKIKKYLEKGPFLGKDKGAGVKLSCLLGNRNLIALVPNKNIVINSDKQGKVMLETSSVYIYDININCIIYQRGFNYPVTNVQLTEKYLIAGNSKRVIAVDYIKEKRNSLSLDELFNLYQNKSARLHIKYFETGCVCEPQQNCLCGKIVMSAEQPRVVAFSYSNKTKIGILNTELDYYYDLQTQNYQDFCLSENGKYLALAGIGGNYVQIIDLTTQKLFTQFRRGFQSKKSLCMRFIKDWFGIVYESKGYATLHLFEMKEKKGKEVINSKFKRYFNTFSFGVDFMICKNELTIVSMICGSLKALDMKLATLPHGQFKKVIPSNELRMWVEIETGNDNDDE